MNEATQQLAATEVDTTLIEGSKHPNLPNALKEKVSFNP